MLGQLSSGEQSQGYKEGSKGPVIRLIKCHVSSDMESLETIKHTVVDMHSLSPAKHRMPYNETIV